jgi:hypothetical protein
MIEIDAKSVVIKAKCFIIGANVPQLEAVADQIYQNFCLNANHYKYKSDFQKCPKAAIATN